MYQVGYQFCTFLPNQPLPNTMGAPRQPAAMETSNDEGYIYIYIYL